jgi:hypothetical protein
MNFGIKQDQKKDFYVNLYVCVIGSRYSIYHLKNYVRRKQVFHEML